MSAQTEILLISAVVAVSCALPGTFLVLRKMALISDAISHSILLGIVIAFFITPDLNSPLLIVGAALMGVMTVTLTEIIVRTRRVKEDAAIGLVFPFLFSLGVILITRFAGNVHLDIDAVLSGEVILTPFDRLKIDEIDLGPRAFWVMIGILVLNLCFIILFYKELKIVTFDQQLAASLGINVGFIHYGLMTITSVTAVGAFDSVGTILVVALMIVPPATAYLLTENLSDMIGMSVLVAIISSTAGFFIAQLFNTSISGSMTTICGIIFFIVLFFAPRRGILQKYFRHGQLGAKSSVRIEN
ncbi:MAG: metal ABC transporter permease [Candidatus Heimdallarchaeota archaeon]